MPLLLDQTTILCAFKASCSLRHKRHAGFLACSVNCQIVGSYNSCMLVIPEATDAVPGFIVLFVAIYLTKVDGKPPAPAIIG